jgi:hypothetical protein
MRRILSGLVASMSLVSVIGLSACGSGVPANPSVVPANRALAPTDAVVSIDGSSITKQTVDHWIRIGAVSTRPNGTSPIVPEPPNYSTCIANGRINSSTLKLSTAQLKSACEHQYEILKQQALGFLISSQWIIREAAHLGVKPTHAEIEKALHKFIAQQFTQPTEFKTFLKYSEQTRADIQLRIEAVSLIPKRIAATIAAHAENATEAQVTSYYNKNKTHLGLTAAYPRLSQQLKSAVKQRLISTQQQAALSRWNSEFRSTWKAKTDCQPMYVVADCKQYKQPASPSPPAK